MMKKTLMIITFLIMISMFSVSAALPSSCSSDGSTTCDGGSFYVCEGGEWEIGESCISDDCKTGTCDDDLGCVYDVKADGVDCNGGIGYCYNAICNTCKGNNVVCSEHYECCSDRCIDGSCSLKLPSYKAARPFCCEDYSISEGTLVSAIPCNYDSSTGSGNVCPAGTACYEFTPVGGDCGVSTCYICKEVCAAEKATCSANGDCCGGYCTTDNRCCPLGAYWDTTANECQVQNKCGLSENIGYCSYFPPNQPDLTIWDLYVYLNTPNCINTIGTLKQACCYFDIKYGENNVYYYSYITTY